MVMNRIMIENESDFITEAIEQMFIRMAENVYNGANEGDEVVFIIYCLETILERQFDASEIADWIIYLVGFIRNYKKLKARQKEIVIKII